MVSHPTTALTGPLQDLERSVLAIRAAVVEEGLAFETPCIPDFAGPQDCPPGRFHARSVIARLAGLAAATEVEAHEAMAREAAAAVA